MVVLQSVSVAESTPRWRPGDWWSAAFRVLLLLVPCHRRRGQHGFTAPVAAAGVGSDRRPGRWPGHLPGLRARQPRGALGKRPVAVAGLHAGVLAGEQRTAIGSRSVQRHGVAVAPPAGRRVGPSDNGKDPRRPPGCMVAVPAGSGVRSRRARTTPRPVSRVRDGRVRIG